MDSSTRFVVAAGTSAGGLHILKQLVGSFSIDGDVAYTLLMHLSACWRYECYYSAGNSAGGYTGGTT